ncbi:MAG: ATP-binding protein [Myxococcales bacterium]|nr:MEDS domain-containing protein [Myxococcales bacterium]
MTSLAQLRMVDNAPPPHDHRVQFYDDDRYLRGVVASFLGSSLSAGQPAVVIATKPHREGFFGNLEAAGFDVSRMQAAGMVTFLDASSTLDTFMVDGMPDWARFRASVGGLLERVGAARPGSRICAYGEMVDLLWRDGNPQAAIRLEEFWNDLAHTLSFSLLCAYVMGNFYKESDAVHFSRICGTHTGVAPTESFPKDDVDARLAEVTHLQQRARALEYEIEQRKQLEKELRDALYERRRAEEALRRSREDLVDFFENAVEGLHWVGPDGTILWANRAELELFGYSKAEYIGHNIAEFHVDGEVIADILASLSRNEILRDRESRIRCKDGSVKTVQIHSNVRFEDGKFVHTRCFTRDVTDRKRLEQELRLQNEQLTRTVKFAEMFIGILGHDLRNPLSAITTGASLIVRRADSDRIVAPATRVLTSAARMARMIDQVLDFTRIRLGRGLPIERTPVDLADICRSAIEELDSAAEPSVTLETSGNVVGLWDADRLAQLVSNLAGNALAHGSPPVCLAVDGNDPQAVTLTVTNGGMIPAELLPVIFEPFCSGTNRKRERSKGLGLGLYISQQVVLAHSGTIDVNCSEQEGTQFVVRLARTPRAE